MSFATSGSCHQKVMNKRTGEKKKKTRKEEVRIRQNSKLNLTRKLPIVECVYSMDENVCVCGFKCFFVLYVIHHSVIILFLCGVFQKIWDWFWQPHIWPWLWACLLWALLSCVSPKRHILFHSCLMLFVCAVVIFTCIYLSLGSLPCVWCAVALQEHDLWGQWEWDVLPGIPCPPLWSIYNTHRHKYM